MNLGVAGAGTMGGGIAQLGALAGLETLIFDPDAEALERGLDRVRADLDRGAERDRWTADEARAAGTRLRPALALEDLAQCEFVVEAAPERLDLKRELFGLLEAAVDRDAILATNTSSIPVSEIAAETAHPQRVCGMHFFNPPPLMKLVEVVAGERTSESTLTSVTELAERMGRTPVRCADSPGFIVNRCNRPFTLESLQMLGEGLATEAQIDLVVREDGGYRMGPFELIDLIGVDVNLSVARSFYAQRPEARWRPHPIQDRYVAEGRLGRKCGRGFYDYEDGRRVTPEVTIDVGLRRLVLERLVAALVNEACFAVDERVAHPADVDSAMKLGLNHPRGPFEWGRALGPGSVLATLDGLATEREAERYRPASALSAWALAGGDAPPSD